MAKKATPGGASIQRKYLIAHLKTLTNRARRNPGISAEEIIEALIVWLQGAPARTKKKGGIGRR